MISESLKMSGHYAECILKAQDGHEPEQNFLRNRLMIMAEGMPVELLVKISKMILEFRIRELPEFSG